MSNKDSFIEGYLERIVKELNVDKDTAFEIFSIAAVVDRSFQEVYDGVLTKGSLDGGIDGVYFREQGDYYIMYVFQCKNSASVKHNEVDKFRNDFRDIFIDGNKVNKLNISDLQPKIDEYHQLSRAGYIIEPKLFFLFNGSKEDPGRGANKQAYDAYHDIEKGFEIWDSDDLYQKISSLIKAQSRREDLKFSFHPESSNIALNDHQALYSFSIQNVRAANFRIKALELCRLVEMELKQNTTYDFLFSENIRGFLGMRARANQKMAQTLDDQDDSIYFPFLNNGITIICQKLTLPNGPQMGEYILPVVNPIIVNGLQTTRVIYSKYKEDSNKLKNVFVNIRLYESDDPALVDKITDATNTQTPINFQDKVSNKDFNFWAKEFFELKGVGYLTKRGETFFNKKSRELHVSIRSDTVLKYWYATFYEKPDVAKNSISTVLENIYDGANAVNPLKKLFDGAKDSPVYEQLFKAYLIYQKVQLEKLNSKEAFIPYADELLAYGVFKELSGNQQAIYDQKKLTDAYVKAVAIVAKITKADTELHQKAGKNFSYPGYFKRPKCKVDYNLEAGIIEQEALLDELVNS